MAYFDSKWVTDSATVVNDIISTYYQLEASSNAQKQALAQAEKVRKDLLAQKAIENEFKRQEQELANSKFSWDKMTWGKQWKLTKQQYLDQRNAALAEMKRTGMLDAVAGYKDSASMSMQRSNQALGQLGA